MADTPRDDERGDVAPLGDDSPDFPEVLLDGHGGLPREPREWGDAVPDEEFPDFETIRRRPLRPRRGPR